MKKTKKLTVGEISKIADDEGLSYGQWVAKYEKPVNPTKSTESAEEKKSFRKGSVHGDGRSTRRIFYENEEQIKKQILGGTTARTVGIRYLISENQLYALLRECQWYIDFRNSQTKVTEEILRELAPTHTARQIAEKLGVSTNRVYHHLRKHGIETVAFVSLKNKWNY